MSNKKEYKNSLRSKEKIQEAVFELIKEKKGLEKVTISDIVQRADVNRGTFYNHYRNINEVLEDIESKVVVSFEKMLEENKESSIADQCLYFFDKLTAFLKENEENLYYIVKYVPMSVFEDLHSRILNSYRTYIIELSSKYIPAEKQHYAALSTELLSQGVAATYLSYFKKETTGSLDDIAHCAIELAKRIIFSNLEN